MIHPPHWGPCDRPLSSHQTFLPEVELRQCVFCKEPLSFWFASRLRNFGLMGSEYNYCASLILIFDFDTTFVWRAEFESWEVCTACNSVSSRLFVNSSNHWWKSRKLSSESRLPSLVLFLCWVSEGDPHHHRGASSSHRSWAGLVDDISCDVDVDDELLPELVDNLGTTRGTKLVKRGFWPMTHSQEYPWSSQSFPIHSKNPKYRERESHPYVNLREEKLLQLL